MPVGYVKPAQAMELVAAMPLDEPQQRRLRATIRRWVKALSDAGHQTPNA